MTFMLLLIVSMFVTGCSTGRPPQSPAVTRNGTLRVALYTEPRTLNPDVAGDETAYVVAASVFNRLVTIDLDGRLLPDLAERWTVDGDGKTYTFDLRRGVIWHDGRPFTADDVKWTMEALREARGTARQLAARIQSIEVVDPHTVRLRLAESWAPFLTTLAQFDTAILPRHRFSGRDWRSHPENMRPVGTGPFKFDRWEHGERLTLVANTAYFKPGPFVERVEYVFAPDPQRADELIIEGRVDLLVGRPRAADIAALNQAPHVALARTPSDSRYYGLFNLKRAPFADRRARLAAHHAVDRQALVQRALGGLGAPALGFYSPSVPWAYNEKATVPAYEPERARALFRSAGARGRRTVILAPGISPFRSLATELARQWSDAGLKATVSFIDPADLSQILSRGDTDWDVVLLGGSNGPDPDVLRVRFASDGVMSFSGFSNPRFDSAVREGGRHSALPIRAAAYRQAQDVLAEELPILPLAESLRVTARARRVYGLPQAEARGLVPDYDFSLVRLRK